jgi:VanZ family protein
VTHARRLVALWLPPVIYVAAIFWISSESNPSLPLPSWPHADKLAHGLAYAGLGALLCRAYGGSGLVGAAAFALATLTASLYGASDEWHQSFVPHRSADAADWLADSVGAALGAFVWVRLRALRRHRAPASIG